MDLTEFLSYKNNLECQLFDEIILEKINSLFKINKKSKKNRKNIKTNIIKKHKKENKFENKFIFILNKMSTDNINNLTIEFLQNIYIDCIEDYNIILELLFNKMINDYNFIDSYILFFLNIIQIFEYNYKFKPDYFIKLCQDNLNTLNEENMVGLLKLIQLLINNNFFNNDTNIYVSEFLLNKNNHIDIYNWFKSNNIRYKYIENIKSIINNCQNIRHRLLLESLLNEEKIIINNNYINNDFENENIFKIQVNNIIDEYKLINDINEVIFFINDECYDTNNKISFCEILLENYFNSNDDIILDLINNLLNKKVLFKNNINNALKNINNIDITKNIFDKFNNKININI